MAMRAAALSALLLLARPAAAHDYPIKPVRVTLRVEPDRVAADIDSDSIYWIEEVVGLHPMPPTDWPAGARAKAEAYVNAHLRLNADGRRLTGRLVAASYVQRPWEVYEQGRYHLRMQYPSAGDAGTLSGEVDFFEDYRQERLEEKRPVMPFQDFRTILTVSGGHRFELKPGSTSFSTSVAAARVGAFPLFLDSVETGALTGVLTAASGWPALAALALSLAPGAPSPRRWAALLAAALFGAAPWPGAPPEWLPWAAGASAALGAGRWLGAISSFWLEAAAAAALGRYWAFEARPWLPSMTPGAFELGGAAAGILVAAAILLVSGLLAANAERRRLSAISESRAAELFERRRRLAATALLIVCAFGLFSGRAG
jgi:hypothetical protein